MRFYLGVHQAHWLADRRAAGVPLFVSARRLRGRRRLPRAAGPWALDSGAFTELQKYGRWATDAPAHAALARRCRDEAGGLEWCAPQDWPCEPAVIAGGKAGGLTFAGTGLSVRRHQRLTLDNYLLLRELAPDVPWVPVLQGWGHEEYLEHAGDYARAGVDLPSLPLVGVGSVCRRQGTAAAERLARELHRMGVKTHLFGFKLTGLRRAARWAASADSMAWSYEARRGEPLPACRGRHANCANCLDYALAWRRRCLDGVALGAGRPYQEVFA